MFGSSFVALAATATAFFLSALPQDDPFHRVWSIRDVGSDCRAIIHNASMGFWNEADETLNGTVTDFEWAGPCDETRLIHGRGSLTLYSETEIGNGSRVYSRAIFEGEARQGRLHGQVLSVTQTRNSPGESWRAAFMEGAELREVLPFDQGCQVNEYIYCDPGTGAGLRNRHVDSLPNGRSGSTAAGGATGAAGAGTEQLFARCVTVTRERELDGEIDHFWALNNVCDAPLQVTYCLRKKYEGAGDRDLCSQGETRSVRIRAGARETFVARLGEDGTRFGTEPNMVLQEGDWLRVIGYACANGSRPSVYFESGQLLSNGC